VQFWSPVCSLVQIEAEWCNLAQIEAEWCKLGQFCPALCSSGANWAGRTGPTWASSRADRAEVPEAGRSCRLMPGSSQGKDFEVGWQAGCPTNWRLADRHRTRGGA